MFHKEGAQHVRGNCFHGVFLLEWYGTDLRDFAPLFTVFSLIVSTTGERDFQLIEKSFYLLNFQEF